MLRPSSPWKISRNRPWHLRIDPAAEGFAPGRKPARGTPRIAPQPASVCWYQVQYGAPRLAGQTGNRGTGHRPLQAPATPGLSFVALRVPGSMAGARGAIRLGQREVCQDDATVAQASERHQPALTGIQNNSFGSNAVQMQVSLSRGCHGTQCTVIGFSVNS
jgi:hypothetical protein